MSEMSATEVGEIMDHINGSQEAQILHYLKMGRHLTPLAALRLFGCFRLAARIHALRGQGHQIKSDKHLIGKKVVSVYWL